MGNAGVFIYAGNYIIQSYNLYAASALAGNAVLRSMMGAVLPLAGPALYASLGANWAGTLLGLLEAAFIPVPFVFYKYGRRIREKSSLIREMEKERRREERRDRRREERAAAAAAEAERREKGGEAEAVFVGEKRVEAEGKGFRAEERSVPSSSSPDADGRNKERDLEKGGL
jgi:hypothetical protein